MNFHFGEKDILNFLVLVPLALTFSLWIVSKQKKQIIKFFGDKNFKYLTSNYSETKKIFKIVLQFAVIFVCIIALARPQGLEKEEQVSAEGIEVMLLVDVSESMMAEDVRPSRLGQVKVELAKLVEMLPGHKVGLVAFAGSASLQSPLTNDPHSLKLYIDSLSPLSVSTQGTDFQIALREAKAAFERGSTEGAAKTSVHRVVIIASDGEDHEQGAIDEAKKMASEGIRIFSLVYGTEKGAPIPDRDSLGNLRGYKKDSSGQTVLTAVKGAALQSLSEAGGGAFHHASFGGNHLQLIVEDINKIEKTKFESKTAKQYEELFQVFLIIAILLGFVDLLMSVRMKRSTAWKGRFELAAFLFGVLFVGFCSGKSFAQSESNTKDERVDKSVVESANSGNSLGTIKNGVSFSAALNSQEFMFSPLTFWQNMKAQLLLSAGKNEEAKKVLLQAIKEKPFQFELHYNLGLTDLISKQVDLAKKSFSYVLENSSSRELKYRAAFNLGFIIQAIDLSSKNSEFAKLIEEALKFYQIALFLKPTSLETKVNIELLTSQQQQQQQQNKDKNDENKDQNQKDENKDKEGKDKKNDKDDKNDKNKDQKKDSEKNKDQNQKDENKDKEGKDKKDEKDDEKNKDRENDKPKQYQNNRPQPKKFDSKELTPGDAAKILDEIRQQELKIRADYNKKEHKERPREKNW